MNVQFIEDDSIDSFKLVFNKVSKDAKSILILSCDKNDYDLNKINSILTSCPVPIIGRRYLI